MSVLALLAKRLAYAAGLIFAVLTINFVLIHAAPGDPALVIAGEMGGADPATPGLSDPNVMSWGLMIGSNRRYLLDAWWAVTFPGFAIFATVLAVSLLGDGLNDALKPTLQRR
jgi:peptide/nickel transport system permease protein